MISLLSLSILLKYGTYLPTDIFLVAGSAEPTLQITAGFEVGHKTAQLEPELFSRT